MHISLLSDQVDRDIKKLDTMRILEYSLRPMMAGDRSNDCIGPYLEELSQVA